MLCATQKADIIVFSFDRPLQLYAFLESIERYVKNIGDIHVIYRSSEERYDRAYRDVFNRFKSVLPIKQGDNPNADFKSLLLKSLSQTIQRYVLFAVDDIVVQDYIDLGACISLMRQNEAYGFYLRLGSNISYCYTLNIPQLVPPLTVVGDGVYAWHFNQAEYDWAYPHTVDMTIYRKREIKNDLAVMDYKAPNSCEGKWASRGYLVKDRKGLCYERSKIVNLPLNKVQTEWVVNRDENSISPLELLELFEQGLKMDIAPLAAMNNNAPHMAYTPTFIKR